MSETQVESSKPAKTGGLLKTRNFGIAAHIDAGKTTVTERILFYTGRIHKMGEVHDGQATTDFLKDEQDRGITIQSAATSAHWDRNGRFTLNLIDTPGHVDFTIEVERSMRVLDGAVAVFDGKEGVEAQSETVWRQADRYRVPRICFINKMDKLGANFEFSFGTISERLGANPIAVQIPVGGGDEFKRAVIDLITMQMIDFGPKEDGSERQIKEIPDEWKAEAEKWRHKLVESVAELDDDLTEKFLEDQEITEDEIRAALRKGTLAMTCCPVLTGSALKSAGIQPLLDAIIDFLPAPVEVPNVQGTDVNDKTKVISRPHDASAPLSALVFKVVNDAHGDLTYTRIYSGTLAKGSRVFNPLNGKKENISRIYRMHANDREALDQATAGDIVALIGVKNSVTGDTLCDPDDPIVLERMEFPDPVISVSIEPQTTADREKLTDALITINREDPSFHFRVDEETGETIISGMGELHLDIVQTKISRDMKIGIHTGKPRVSYRESITKPAEVKKIHKKQTGGRGQFADVTITVEPYTEEQAEEEGLNFNDQFTFESKIVGGAIPREYIPSVEAGCRSVAKTGVLAGYPVQGVKVKLIDGSFHEVDSSQQAFETCGAMAFKDAVKAAGPALLEPIMKVVITTPEEFLGSVTGDISSRRGLIIGQEQRGVVTIVEAEAPLSEMFGYVTALRGMSQGRASSSMEPLEYRQVPGNIAEQILAGKA